MKELGNYECEGQMNIFDFLEDLKSELPEASEAKHNNFWHEVPSVLPTNTNWMPALFVLYNQDTNEFHYNVPGEVKDKTFKKSKSPAGEVVAWRYCDEKFESDV